jgi:hypothetical protein
MPKVSMFYPQQAWAVTNIRNHPRAVACSGMGMNHPEYFLAQAVGRFCDAVDEGKFQAGMPLRELLASQPGRDFAIMQALAEELVRMRLYVLDYSTGEPRMIPATQAVAEETKQIQNKAVTYYLPVDLIEAVKVVADKRHQSASAVMHQALEVFLGDSFGA